MAGGSQLNHEATTGLTSTAFINNVAVTLRLLLISRWRMWLEREKKDRAKKRDEGKRERESFNLGIIYRTPVICLSWPEFYFIYFFILFWRTDLLWIWYIFLSVFLSVSLWLWLLKRLDREKTETQHMQATFSHQEILLSPRQSKWTRGEDRKLWLLMDIIWCMLNFEKLFAGLW